jgi:hypothetical protein
MYYMSSCCAFCLPVQRQYDVFNSRDCVKKTRDGPGGLAKVSELALANAR